MKAVGFGIIGCGAIADVHLQAISGMEHARLCAVSSRSEERARETGQRHGCDWTTDYRELLARRDIEAVCVTTSSGSHAEIGMAALEAGKHVVMEKPLAMTSAAADDMIRFARDKGLVLTVISQTRFMEHHRLVKQVVDEGRLGRLLLIEASRPFYRTQDYYDSAEWRGTLAHDGGAMMNQGIHTIDLVLWLGGRSSAVSGAAATQTHRMEAEDIGLARIAFANGAFGTLMCSTSLKPGFPPRLHVYGEHGAVLIEGPMIVHWSVPGLEKPAFAEAPKSGGGASDPRNIGSDYHKLQLEEFARALNDGREPAVAAQAGRDAVRLIELVYESARQGGREQAFD